MSSGVWLEQLCLWAELLEAGMLRIWEAGIRV